MERSMLPLLNEFQEKFLSQGMRPKDARSKIYHCRYFAEWYGSENMRKVSPGDIERYKVYLMTEKKSQYSGKNLAYSTIVHRLYDILEYFEFLLEHKEIFFDPTLRLKIPIDKGTPIHYMSEKEMQALIQAPDTKTYLGLRDRLVFELLYTCPLRNNELCRLKLSEIDMKKKVIYPSRSKGGRECGIPIASSTYQVLEKYLARRLLKKTRPNLEELMVSYHGRCPDRFGHPANFRQVSRKGQYAHSSHAMRHTCCVHMLRHGAGIRDLQVLLGHRRLTSTEHYTQLTTGDLKAMQDKYHPRERYAVAGTRGRAISNEFNIE